MAKISHFVIVFLFILTVGNKAYGKKAENRAMMFVENQPKTLPCSLYFCVGRLFPCPDDCGCTGTSENEAPCAPLATPPPNQDAEEFERGGGGVGQGTYGRNFNYRAINALQGIDVFPETIPVVVPAPVPAGDCYLTYCQRTMLPCPGVCECPESEDLVLCTLPSPHANEEDEEEENVEEELE